MVKDEPRIEVCPLLTKYPQGGERTLIYAVTGREINSSMLPADAGCIVDNIDTVASIYNAVCKTTPLIRKIITVTGDAIAEPQNFEVRLGTNYQRLVEAAGGFKQEPEKMISGGPMMGQALFSLDFPVAKTSSDHLYQGSGSSDGAVSMYPLRTLRRRLSGASCTSADDEGIYGSRP